MTFKTSDLSVPAVIDVEAWLKGDGWLFLTINMVVVGCPKGDQNAPRVFALTVIGLASPCYWLVHPATARGLHLVLYQDRLFCF
jgi:hypothetical protein